MATPTKRTADVLSEEEPVVDDASDDSADEAGVKGNVPGKRAKRSQVTLSDGRVVSSKVRNHVNPLLPHFQKPVPIPEGGDWSKVYADPSLPIVLDIGCAKGRFCLEGAKMFPKYNWLGIEIREPLVVRANMWVKEQGLPNCHYIFGNASAGVVDLIKSMPPSPGGLSRVTIQCPDPWFKKKHQKRKMLNHRLAEELAEHLPVGASIFVQSDVEQVSMMMVDSFAVTGRFERVASLPSMAADAADAGKDGGAVEPVERKRPTAGRDYQATAVAGGEWANKGAGADAEGSYQWLEENPLGLMSERESSTISRGLPIFRAVFTKLEAPVSTQPAADTAATSSA